MSSRSLACLCVLVAISVDLPAQELLGLIPQMGTQTQVIGIDVAAGVATQSFGVSALPSLSGMDVQPGTGRVFVSGGNTDGGHLYRLLPGTNILFLVGATGFPNVPGLAFAPNGALFGSAHVAGPTLNANGLIAIDPVTGAGTLVGAYGTQLGQPVRGVNALAVHPQTGVLYGIANTAFNGNNGDLFTIDPLTGAATHAGTLVEVNTGAAMPATVAGLAFDNQGQLFGSLGGGDGRIVAIDLAAMTFAVLGDAADGSVSDIAFRPRSLMYGLNPVFDQDTHLLAIQGEPFSRADLGLFGMPSLSGLDVQPATGVLYASGGNTDGGHLYTVDPSSVAATLVGPTGFPNVPGLAFDLNGDLYGAAYVAGPSLNANGLIQIDAATGAGTLIGTFGVVGGFPVRGMNALAIEPFTGTLIGSTNAAYDGTTGEMWTIDKATGAASLLGTLTEMNTGAIPPATVAGLTFDEAGRLFGSFGGGDGRIIQIDLAALTYRVVGQGSPSGSVSDIANFHLPAIGIGFEKAGAMGAPHLGALGGLAPGENALFRLSNAPPGVAAVMVLSNMVNPTPFLGGLLAPIPAIVPGVFLTDANGNVDLTFLGGVFPGGTALSMQYVVFDPTATFQTSLSNAVVILFR